MHKYSYPKLSISPEIFDWVQTQGVAGQLKDIHRVVYNPLLLCAWGHCPVGKWTFCPVWGSECSGLGFIKAISIFWCIELFFYSDESLSPCRWKTATQHEAATSTLYFWDGILQVMSSAWFPLNMMVRIEVHQTREYCFSESEGPLGAFLYCHKAQIGGVLRWCLSFCKFFPSAYMIMELN